MKNCYRILLVMWLLGLAAVSAWGSPSLGGYTGLINVPNADALAASEFNVGWVNHQFDGKDLNNYFGNYGLPVGGETTVEVGVNVLHPEDEDQETLLSAKWAIRPEAEGTPGFAVGVIDATDMLETTVYIAGSKILTAGPLDVFGGEILNPRLTVGLGGGSLDGLFAGLSAGLGKAMTLMAEYDSNNVNVGARIRLYKGLGAQGGWLDVGGEDDFSVGVYYSSAR